MEKMNKQSLLYVIGVVALLVIAYYSRAFHTQVDEPILKMLLVMIRSVIQISLVIAWCSSVRTRIINKQVRHYSFVRKVCTKVRCAEQYESV